MRRENDFHLTRIFSRENCFDENQLLPSTTQLQSFNRARRNRFAEISFLFIFRSFDKRAEIFFAAQSQLAIAKREENFFTFFASFLAFMDIDSVSVELTLKEDRRLSLNDLLDFKSIKV